MSGLDLGLPLDWRLLAVMGAILLGSYAKGVVGLGVPFIATPIAAILYDLRTAILLVAIPMTLSDLPFVALGLPHLHEARRLVPFIAFGVIGMFFGAQMLVSLDERILLAVLATVMAVFVVTSWFQLLPVLSKRAARYLGPPFGFIAGVIQGSAGLSGPLATMYLLSLGISRGLFMFAINAIFQVLDATQVVALYRLGLYTPGVLALSVVGCVPMALGVLLGLKTQRHVNDLLFRRIVLLLLALSAANLFGRVISRL